MMNMRAAQDNGLSGQQQTGRRVFAQSCGVCHLPPVLGAKTYGPPLDKDAGGGDDDVMREFTTNGTPRMPTFKYYLKPDEIEAIISYVRTVPVRAAVVLVLGPDALRLPCLVHPIAARRVARVEYLARFAPDVADLIADFAVSRGLSFNAAIAEMVKIAAASRPPAPLIADG